MMTHQHDSVVIAGYARTPIGNFQGCLSGFSAAELGSVAIKAAINRAAIDIHTIDTVLMGCVLSAGIGQAPARQAALKAGLPVATGTITINKMCGSGMQAVMLGHDLIKSGSADIVVAGGMESMSNAPYLLPRIRKGKSLGSIELLDHLILDGLEDPKEKKLMGCFAEECAERYAFSRSIQDDFARQSLLRAQNSIQKGLFEREIEPVSRSTSKTAAIYQDENPPSADSRKIARLKPVFKPDGTLTAANSSSISDGAAALVLMSSSAAEQSNVTPIATIVAHQSHAHQPGLFTTAPVYAVQKLLQKQAMQTEDIDLYEINEAFAVVPLAAMHELGLAIEKVNIHGGACALGHPIGASGARIIVTLLSALQHYQLKRGLATLCIGGGEATAILIEI